MTPERGLALAVGLGTAGRADAHALTVGWSDDADVPLAPGDDFPFEDRAVHSLHAGAFVADLPLARLVHLLLEARRVLRPGGELRIDIDDTGPDPAAAVARLHEHALLVGLDRAVTLPPGRTLAPAIDDHGAMLLTKRDRRVVGSPLVSIAIPAYNPRYFATALDSALAQTYANVEIVVCDDSADDAIRSVVDARSVSAVRYLRNRERLRPRGNFTRCFEESRGEFVKFLCDDDVLAPTCVERLMDAFRAAPDVTLATSQRARIDGEGRALPPLPATLPIVAEDALIAGPTLANAMLMAGLNTVGEPSTALFRRADLAAHAPDYFAFRGSAGHGIIDLVTWTRLLMKGNAVYLRDTLSAFRFHREQRQHDPAMRERSVASIRALQASWLALEVHERQAPDQLLVQPFPPDGDDWQPRTVQGVSVRRT
jgi:hypothetical protein